MRSRLALVSRRVGFVGLGSMGSGSLEAKGRFGGVSQKEGLWYFGVFVGVPLFWETTIWKIWGRVWGSGFSFRALAFMLQNLVLSVQGLGWYHACSEPGTHSGFKPGQGLSSKAYSSKTLRPENACPKQPCFPWCNILRAASGNKFRSLLQVRTFYP